MTRRIVAFVSIILFATSLYSQIKPYYAGGGYNISFAPLKKLNHFIYLYDSTKSKIGGWEMDKEMEKMKILTGINFTAGFMINDILLDVSWTRRQKDVFATYQIPYYIERHVKYKTGTLGFGMYAPLSDGSDKLRLYGGLSVDFIGGKLLTLLTENNNKEWKVLNKLGNFGISPTALILYQPSARIPVDLGIRMYYQANIAKRSVDGLEKEMYNHWDDEIDKLRVTGGNLGIVFQVLINIPSIKNRPERDVNPVEIPVQTDPLMITLSGTVTDSTSGQPVNAIVSLTNPEGKKVSMLADNGKYSARVNNNLTYKVNVESFGYKDFNSEIVVHQPVSEYMTRDFRISMIEEGQAMVLNNIYFKVASADLLSESFPELEKIASFMKANPNIAVEISGHTSSEGNDDYNLNLSKDRAAAIKTWLITHGISENRIETIGYGKTKPVADNNTEEGRKMNRRVEFRIIKNK